MYLHVAHSFLVLTWPEVDVWLYRAYLLATVVGVIGGLIGLYFLIQQFRETRIAATAAADSANAAKQSLQATLNMERAWIFAELSERITGIYELRLTNAGRTPAYLTSFEISFSCLPEGNTDLPGKADLNIATRQEISLSIKSGDVIAIGDSINIIEYISPHRAKIEALTHTGVFYGNVTYRHLFSDGAESRSDFCYVYTVSLYRLSSVGRHTRYT